MDKNQPNRNLILENLLSKLDIYCKHHFIQVSETAYEEDEEGCSEHMSRLEIEKHEAVCAFAFIACEHSSVCGMFRRGSMEAHLAICPYKPVQCRYCETTMQRKALEAHFPECPDLPLTCRHCSLVIAQKRMKRHLDRECEGKMHECPYAAQGCEAGKMEAKALALHLTQDSAEHLELLQLSMASNLKLLENKFLKKLAIKDAEIEELRRASRNRYRFEWHVPWKHVPGDTTTIRAYTSEKFDIFGRKFYLALWPIGEPKQNWREITSFGHFPGIENPSAVQQQGPSQPNFQRENSSSSSSSATSAISNAISNANTNATTTAMAIPSSPAPALGTSPKSFSMQLFDRLRSFGRSRSSSVDDQRTLSMPSSQDGEEGANEGQGTWVAIYLMMEPQQPAPPATTAAPRIYSPVSGLATRHGTSSSTGSTGIGSLLSQQDPTSLSASSAWHPMTHDPLRNMNVNLRQSNEHSNPLPMRPPESMVLEYTLRLINNSPLLTKSAYFDITFPLPNGDGWGEEKFIETTQISRAAGFLNRNNSLHIQCDIQVRQCTFDV
jgi:hypothetical protein